MVILSQPGFSRVTSLSLAYMIEKFGREAFESTWSLDRFEIPDIFQASAS